MIFYGILAYYSSRKPILFSRIILSKYRDSINSGANIENESLFVDRPKPLLDIVETYQFTMLKVSHLIDIKKYSKALEECLLVKEEYLFDNEVDNLKVVQAHLLMHLGDINRSISLMEQIKDKSNPNYLLLKANIAEIKMDLDEESTILTKLVSTTHIYHDYYILARIYNDFGRFRFNEGNYIDALNYYKKSYKCSKLQNNCEMIHCSAYNLIHASIINGEFSYAEQVFAEYDSICDDERLNDLTEKLNLKVEISRQLHDQSKISEAILEGNEQIRNKLDEKQLLLFEISIMRMMFNNNMDISEIVGKINKKTNEYLELDFPDKYFSMKELYVCFKVLSFKSNSDFKNTAIYEAVFEYFNSNAIQEIETYLSSLKDYEISLKCKFELEKIVVQKELPIPYDFKRIYRRMNNVRDIYVKNNMLLNTIFIDLDILDECLNLENSTNGKIKVEVVDLINEHLKSASTSVEKIKRFTRAAEVYVRLSHYYLMINKIDESRKYYKLFLDSGVSINNFTLIIQDYYHSVTEYYSRVNLL